MFVLAVYFPKPEELYRAIAALVVAYLVLCLLAYLLRLSVPIAASLMAIGTVIGFTQELLLAQQVRPGAHDVTRNFTGTTRSDAFFELTSNMHVGYVCLHVFAYMLFGLFLQVFAVEVYRWRIRRATKRELVHVPLSSQD